MMDKTVAAMHSLGEKGDTLGDMMRGFDRLKGVSFTPGQTISCVRCTNKAPLRKVEDHYMCERCYREQRC